MHILSVYIILVAIFRHLLAIFWLFFAIFRAFEKVNRLKKFPNKVFEKLKKEQMLTNLAAKLWALPQNLDQN